MRGPVDRGGCTSVQQGGTCTITGITIRNTGTAAGNHGGTITEIKSCTNESSNPNGLPKDAAKMNGASVDGGEPWYALAQAWAMANGVSDGTNPNNAITREQLAAMRMRYCENISSTRKEGRHKPPLSAF